MADIRAHTATIALLVWGGAVLGIMLLTQSFNLEIFFVLWLIGLLFILEFLDTPRSTTPYLRYLRLVIAAGVMVFAFIVVQKVLLIISS